MRTRRTILGRGFTLVELLVVIAIISILASILFPVFARARDKAYQTTCRSNQRQMGIAILQYVQDYDEQYPSGLCDINGKRVWAGEGWAGQCIPYMKSAFIYHCPSDPAVSKGNFNWSISYGYNINFVNVPGAEDEEHNPPPPGVHLGDLLAPSRSVMLFEVSNVLANVVDVREGADFGGKPGRNYSASSNGLDNRLYAQRDWSTDTENQYATGYLGGRRPPDPKATQFKNAHGRHSEGSIFLFGDGHAKWLRGDAVSSGINATLSECFQDNYPNQIGCDKEFHAEGTGTFTHSATFSIR